MFDVFLIENPFFVVVFLEALRGWSRAGRAAGSSYAAQEGLAKSW